METAVVTLSLVSTIYFIVSCLEQLMWHSLYLNTQGIMEYLKVNVFFIPQSSVSQPFLQHCPSEETLLILFLVSTSINEMSTSQIYCISTYVLYAYPFFRQKEQERTRLLPPPLPRISFQTLVDDIAEVGNAFPRIFPK